MLDFIHLLPALVQVKTNKRLLRVLTLAGCLSATFFFWYLSANKANGPEIAVDWSEEEATDHLYWQPETLATAAHVYRSDGLLEVNPAGAHPIFELLRNAEERWSKKLQGASKTFDEAFNEYVKRYHRLPPVGFDTWWDYVVEHNVQLPDEYDAIYRSLEPFWGVDPLDLQKLTAYWDKEDERIIVVGKENGGPLQILRNSMEPSDQRPFHERSVQSRIDVVKDVEHLLPDFRAHINPFDNPSRMMDWELVNSALDAAAARTYIDINNPPSRKEGWLSACSPRSPARMNPPAFTEWLPDELPPKPKKTFIYNHRLAMDPCLHPQHLIMEGQFLAHHTGPVPHRAPLPQFASCVTTLHLDILPIAPQNSNDDPDPILWKDKPDERLLWRGSNTGMWHAVDNKWQQSQRPRLVRMANNFTGFIHVLPSPKRGEENRTIGEGESWPKSRVNPAIMDIGFVDRPIACDEESCETLRESFDWKRKMPTDDSHNYKYILDVDGNGWSSRFRRLLSTHSLIFKSTIFPEWFTDRIQPWVHYIPISLDYSDLYDAFIFFRGDIKGENNHDDLAEKIATAGRDWTHTYWRREDMTAYMFRMYLEYARVMSLDREAMTMQRPSSDVL